MTTELLTAQEAAAFLRLAPQTLARRRCEGAPPAFVVMGRRRLYRRADLLDFVERQRRTSTSDRGPDDAHAAD